MATVDEAWAEYHSKRLRGDVACDVAFRSAWEAATAAERERMATFIENMDDGPITTKAVKSYIAAEIRARG